MGRSISQHLVWETEGRRGAAERGWLGRQEQLREEQRQQQEYEDYRRQQQQAEQDARG